MKQRVAEDGRALVPKRTKARYDDAWAGASVPAWLLVGVVFQEAFNGAVLLGV